MEKVTMYRSENGILYDDEAKAVAGDNLHRCQKSVRTLLSQEATEEVMDNLYQLCEIFASFGFVKSVHK